MAEDTIKIQVELEKDNKSFAQIEKDARESGERTATEFATGFIGGAAAKAALLAGAIVGALFSKKSIDAAIESEKAITAFNRALARTGEFSQLATDSFQRFATQIQLSTGVADEAVLDVATRIQNLGSLTTSELQRATQATLDLSAALGIDLDSAATLVGKAATGNIAALNKLGIEIRKGKDDAQTFANTLTTLESRFAGASSGALNTFSGSLLSLSNGFGDILEEIGKFITQSPALVAVVREFGKLFVAVSESIASVREGSTVVDTIVRSFITLSQVITDFVIRPIEILANILKIPINLIRELFALLFRFFGFIIERFGALGNLVGIVSEETLAKLRAFRESTFEIEQQIGKDLLNAFSFESLGSQSASNAIDGFLSKLQTAAEQAGPLAETLKNNVKGPLTEIAQVTIDVGQQISQGLASAIGAGLQRIGAALVQGGSAFNDFGKVVLGIIGDLAINIGTTLISMGIAIGALKGALLTLNPAAAIAAGAALVVLGGALKAIGSGGANAAGAAGSPVATTPAQPSNDFSPDSLAGQSSRVTINIQGDVLDSRDTGLRIVELIQDAFDTDGARVVTA